MDTGPETERGVETLEALLDDLLWVLLLEIPEIDRLAFIGGGARNFGADMDPDVECLPVEIRLGGPATGLGVVAVRLIRPLLIALGGRDFVSLIRSSAIARSSSEVCEIRSFSTIARLSPESSAARDSISSTKLRVKERRADS